MNRRKFILVTITAVASVLTATSAAAADLFIGTQGLGNVTPAAAYPFGLVQAGPDTSVAREAFWANKGHCAGYQHGDGWIWRFSQLHISGTGCPSFGDFGIMPYAGAEAWRRRLGQIELGEGTMETFADGLNADLDATDYRHYTSVVAASAPLKVKLSPGGGFTARFTKGARVR